MRFIATGTVLILALLCTTCGPKAPRWVTPDPALMSLVPPNTVMLAGIRLDHLRESPFYREHLASRTSAALENFIGQTGVDPRENVWEALAAYNGTDLVVMSRGKFSAREIEPRLGSQGAERKSYKGYTIIGDENAAVLLVDASTIVAGRPDCLRATVDRIGQPAGPPPALEEMVKTVERVNQFWAVSIGGLTSGVAPEQGNLAMLNRLLEKLKNFKASGSLSDRLVVNAEGECGSPEDAETLQSALRMMIGLVRLGARGRPALTGLCDAIAVSRQEHHVLLDAELSGELLEQVLAEAGPESKPAADRVRPPSEDPLAP